MAALENKIAKLADEKLLLTDKLSQSSNPNGTLDEIIKLLRNYPAIHWNVCENGSLLVKKVILKTAFAAPLGYDRHNGYRAPQVSIILHFLRKSHQNIKWCGQMEFAQTQTIPQLKLILKKYFKSLSVGTISSGMTRISCEGHAHEPPRTVFIAPYTSGTISA